MPVSWRGIFEWGQEVALETISILVEKSLLS